jgi:hypothetical protein
VRAVPTADEDALDDADSLAAFGGVADDEAYAAESHADAPPEFSEEPEMPYVANPDEPDLFNPLPPRGQSAGDYRDVASRPAAPRKFRFPIFQIGGRLEKADAMEPRDEEAHARRQARIQAFVSGLAKLKSDVGRRLPEPLHQKRVWLVGCAGLLVVAMMVTGISLLFKLTGADAKAASSEKAVRIAPPPPLYVD